MTCVIVSVLNSSKLVGWDHQNCPYLVLFFRQQSEISGLGNRRMQGRVSLRERELGYREIRLRARSDKEIRSK